MNDRLGEWGRVFHLKQLPKGPGGRSLLLRAALLGPRGPVFERPRGIWAFPYPLLHLPTVRWVVLFHHDVRPQDNTGLKATVLTALRGLDSSNLGAFFFWDWDSLYGPGWVFTSWFFTLASWVPAYRYTTHSALRRFGKTAEYKELCWNSLEGSEHRRQMLISWPWNNKVILTLWEDPTQSKSVLWCGRGRLKSWVSTVRCEDTRDTSLCVAVSRSGCKQ